MGIRYGDRPRVGSRVSEWLNRKERWYTLQPQTIVNQATATATANSSANTKGAWTELVALTSANIDLIVFQVVGVRTNGTNTATLLDIGIGASGSETVLVADVGVGGADSPLVTGTSYIGGVLGMMPLQIPSGSRLSARIQSVVTGGKTGTVTLSGYSTDSYADSPVSVDLLSTSDTATSQALAMSGASGSYVQVVASTSKPYRAVAIIPSCHNASTGALGNISYTVAVGGAGSEVDLGSVLCYYDAGERAYTSTTGFNPMVVADIPQGARLSVKHEIPATPERYGVTIVGIPA